jgi:MoaA/NifB/PqqE/SkfB family radical SAM enzyme
MTAFLQYLRFGIDFFWKTRILRQSVPLMGGLVLTERCNLSCSHCKVANRPGLNDLSKAEALDALKQMHGRGSQFLAITGGEPMIWNEGDDRLDDLIVCARQVGYKLISVYTNGTLPLKSEADVLFVSLNGLKPTGDAIIREKYETVIRNLRNAHHPYIVINTTINAKNWHEIEPFCAMLREIKTVKAIFFYLHTPYYGIDELLLDSHQRNEVILEIIRLKKLGYPVMNSTSCLHGVKNGKWQRPGTLCEVYANGKLFQCCRENGNKQACENCGYLGYAELEYIAKLNVETVLNTLRYLPDKFHSS